MFSLQKLKRDALHVDTHHSELFDQDRFYQAFEKDLREAKSHVFIESPFITNKRLTKLIPVLRSLERAGVRVIINTKPYNEHNEMSYWQLVQIVGTLQEAGITVLFTVGLHRKIAIIDDILWEGSLNILSQNDSCEIMRRTKSKECVQQMHSFIQFDIIKI